MTHCQTEARNQSKRKPSSPTLERRWPFPSAFSTNGPSIFGLVEYGCSNRTESMGLRTMAISACAKCEGHTFERGLVTPLGEQRLISALQCAGCGTLVLLMRTWRLNGCRRKSRDRRWTSLVRIAKALSEAASVGGRLCWRPLSFRMSPVDPEPTSAGSKSCNAAGSCGLQN